jgi:hypothetical protein
MTVAATFFPSLDHYVDAAAHLQEAADALGHSDLADAILSLKAHVESDHKIALEDQISCYRLWAD